jgi:uncharacterized membrane protein
MTIGFLYAIGAALIWSFTNLIDKHLTNKYAKGGDVWGIVILSCLFPVALIPLAINFDSAIIQEINFFRSIILMLTGSLMVAWIYLYLKALTEEDTSVVMTLLVLAPLFSFILAQIILGEVLTTFQIIAGTLIVAGALVVSYKSEIKKLNTRLLYYAVSASLVTAIMHVLFKYLSVDGEASYWDSIFWRSFGMVATGVVLSLSFQKILDSFSEFVLEHFSSAVKLNTLNESMTLAGDLLFAFAVLIAPVALVQSTESFQPIFIILISIILYKLFGVTSVQEDLAGFELLKKALGICLVICGSFLLLFNS